MTSRADDKFTSDWQRLHIGIIAGKKFTINYSSNGQYTMKSMPIINKKEHTKMPNNSKPGVSADLYVW
jgi:hypothetical protein